MIQHLQCNIIIIYRPVDVVLPHTEDKITLTFGTSLKSDPCDSSYGIDDIMLFIK